VQYLVADNLVVRIKSVPFKRAVVVKDPLLEVPVEQELTAEEVAAKRVDPRCLGFQSDEVRTTGLILFFFFFIVLILILLDVHFC
jgi:hypothetical protein